MRADADTKERVSLGLESRDLLWALILKQNHLPAFREIFQLD